MKLKTPILAGLCAILVPVVLNAAPEKETHAEHTHTEKCDHDHAPAPAKDEHAGHDHAKDEHAGHDHDDKEHAKDDHAGHDHDNPAPGPNKGKVFSNVEPHVELFVTKDRKLQFTFVDHDNKIVPAGDQTIRVICGTRANPTRLAFEKSGDSFVSTKPLPEGMLIPTVLQIKTAPTAKNVMTRFNLNLNDCPTCEFLEYCCTCDHGHEGDDHAGHDH